MRVARITTSAGAEFAVSDDDAWIVLSSLGFDTPDTSAVIESISEIGRAIADYDGERLTDVELLSPVVRPPKILAIGLNYLDHIKETRSVRPDVPLVFAKYTNSLNGPFAPVVIDAELTAEGDYESELAVVIGRHARHVSRADALSVVFGYAVANDVSARDLQRSDAQFSRSKSFDTFCPIGPWITTADEVPDPQGLRISSNVNGEVRQDASTADMIFDVQTLIAFLSTTMTLEPGDVILTGTPPGVGIGRTPPVFLVPGDVVRCEIEGLGAIENNVEAPTTGAP